MIFFQDPITKKYIWIYPFSHQVRKFLVSAFVVSFSICIVFISVTTVILFKVSMKIYFNCTSAEDGDIDVSEVSRGIPRCLMMTTVLPSVLNGISILLFGYVYTRIAEKLTQWGECKKFTHSVHKKCSFFWLLYFITSTRINSRSLIFQKTTEPKAITTIRWLSNYSHSNLWIHIRPYFILHFFDRATM
jgi:hypothetical protein